MLRVSFIDLYVYIKGEKKAEKSIAEYLKEFRKWIVNYSISKESQMEDIIKERVEIKRMI